MASLQPRFLCRSCTNANDSCAEFTPQDFQAGLKSEIDCTLTADVLKNAINPLCYCSHPYLDHNTSEGPPVPPATNLPPKGGCTTSNCLQFQTNNQGVINVHSICVCGKGWLAHANLRAPPSTQRCTVNTTPHPAASSADEIPVEAWAPPPAPIAGSANDRRVASYRSHAPHRMGITSNGSPFVANTTTGGNTRYVGNTTSRCWPSGPFLQSSRRSQNVHTMCDSITFKVVLIPYPLPDLYRHLDSHHLVIETTVTVGDSVILDQLNSQINTHFLSHNICFPSLLYEDHQPTGSSLKYEKLNWVILELGKLSADQNTQLLKMALFTSRDITGSALSVLMRKIGMTMKNPIDDVPLLFIAPRFGTLRGTIASESHAADTAVHPCFAARVMDTFFTEAIPEPSREPRCLSSCPSQFDDQSDSDDDSLSMDISELIVHQNSAPSSSSALLTVPTRTPIVTRPFGSRPTSVRREAPSRSSMHVTRSLTRRPIGLSNRVSPPSTLASAVTIDLTSNDTPVFSSIIDWANYVQAHGPRETSTIIPWRVKALNVELGALALIAFIEAQHSRTVVDLSGEKYQGTQIGFTPENDGSDMNLSSLFMADCTFKVGEGIGLGVERAVISRAIKIVLDEHYMWQVTNNEGFRCPSIIPFASDSGRLICFKTHGTLCALHIFRLHLPPMPCSPFLLCYAIWGFNALIDPAFIQKLAPDTAASLAALPLDPTQPLDYSLAGPLSPLLATYSNIQPMQLPANISVEQHMELIGQVYANTLLGCPPRAALDMLKELYYFCQGFDVTFSNDAASFCNTLKPSAKDLLCLLYDQCITSPSQVIERLEFEVALVSQPDGTEADVVDSDTENAFILRLTRYLRGKGHPNHPLISECVPESERNSQEGSTTFRAKIIFQFREEPAYATHICQACLELMIAGRFVPLLPVQFQTCTYRVCVPVTSALMAALAGEIPEDDDIVTPFGLWAHLTLCPLSAKGPAYFNAT
ncbi:hypothetical protein EDD22DRAFT_950020 [Suillus occidentalis]|nr:hypothetical protein EDD22DRAFT_950020 [Suillus occidentalis]